jgi:hypothetical protein
VAVRYLTGDTHPDDDTICEFRRENGKVVKQAFVEVLRLGRQKGLVKEGAQDRLEQIGHRDFDGSPLPHDA